MGTQKTPSPPADGIAETLTYRFRPRLIGAEFAFRLDPEELAWDWGSRRGRIAYRDIVRVRLGYRPANLAGSRYVAEVWGRDGTKLQIASVTQRSLFDFQNLAAEYRVFIVDLARRIRASGGSCRYDAGFPAWRWWPAVLVAAATMGSAIYVAVRALIGGYFVVSAAVVALGLVFLWQIGLMIWRNRPRNCDPLSISGDVLP
ncbi:MAG: hypothetical protein JO353_01445 [Phycisphaerae bacterium]|nr:hypothetical protein [Phycisphaerae bacterium]